MGQDWYFVRDGQRTGPVEWGQLQTLAQSNQVTPGDEVWSEGFAAWRAASSIPELYTPGALPPAETIPTAPVAKLQYESVSPQTATPAAMVNDPYTPQVDLRALPGPRLECAGFWRRFFACLIDGAIVLALDVVLAAGFVWYIGSEAARSNASMVSIFIRVAFIVVGWIYCASLESGPGRSTLGKRLLGLRVTDTSGKQISFGRATGRHFGKIISQLILCIGYLMMLFMPNNQTLHDLMAGCVVLKEEWA